MYSKWQLAKKYMLYWWRASNSKGHGVHSPFVFNFITQVLNDKRLFYCYETIEAARKELKNDNTVLTIEDFGAGSRIHAHTQRSVKDIASSSLKPKKYSQLLFRMVNYFQPETILELGTSLGITTAYLACGKADAQVITMEGAKAVAAIAQQNFKSWRLKNIQLVTGNFNDTLPGTIAQLASIDFAFVDGNHRLQPTLDYFNQLLPKVHEYSVLIFDDIHWSGEMEEAWNTIKAHEQVRLTIDLFFIGIVYFRKENKVKQDFAIRF
ncbi:class I SAM-dependent methyltransferase [Ilyomonas limi]|uniref:Class I SAM-dependent methyltransferase n=1 Tax=Ilyomonas limi TaxID=2575867 RepID=A0A4U3L880_9BACT|nr:class I SAM-dependent methyltransferase [Ilyomonas limi]TKK69897.1 class I SAM-dependent methyltransferase [Ilyomonas limi]